MVYGSSRMRPARSPCCAGGKSSSPASRSGRERWRACPVFRPRFRWPIPTTRGAVAPPWPTGSPARETCSPGVRSPIASGTITSAAESSRRPTTSAATAPCRPIPSCSTGWPSSCAINGQSLKALHRLIVCSAVYRQASRDNPAFDAIDADNRYLWRQNRRRLDAEAIRDSVLAVSGTLDRRMGGPGFELFSFKDDHSPIYDHTDPAKVDNPQVRRRTVYRFIVRSVPNPFMEALDCADPNLNTPVRSQTLTALQALALWNDLFMVRQSQEFARRLEQTCRTTRARGSSRPIASRWAENPATTSATPWPLTRPGTAWPTPAACSGIPTSSSSSTEPSESSS